MKTAHALAFTVLLGPMPCAAQPFDTTAVEPRFDHYLSDLQPGDTLTIEWVSTGCFHSFKYTFRFIQREDLTVLASCDAGCQNWVDSLFLMEEREPGPIGELELSPAQIQHFDNYLDAVLERGNCSCTTVEHLHFSLNPVSGRTRRAHLKDSCCAWIHGNSDQLTFEDLLLLITDPTR